MLNTRAPVLLEYNRVHVDKRQKSRYPIECVLELQLFNLHATVNTGLNPNPRNWVIHRPSPLMLMLALPTKIIPELTTSAAPLGSTPSMSLNPRPLLQVP